MCVCVCVWVWRVYNIQGLKHATSCMRYVCVSSDSSLAQPSPHTLTVASATVRGVCKVLCIIKCVIASVIIMLATCGLIMFGFVGEEAAIMFSQQRSQVHADDDVDGCGCVSEGGVVKFSSNDDGADDGGGEAGENSKVEDGVCAASRNDGGGGGGDIGVVAVGAAAAAVGAAKRRFLFRTNRRSFAANGGILRLRGDGVGTFSSSASSLS